MDDKIKKAYLEYLTNRVNDMDYSEIDCFCEDNELSEDDIQAIQSLPLKVVVDEQLFFTSYNSSYKTLKRLIAANVV